MVTRTGTLRGLRAAKYAASFVINEFGACRNSGIRFKSVALAGDNPSRAWEEPCGVPCSGAQSEPLGCQLNPPRTEKNAKHSTVNLSQLEKNQPIMTFKNACLTLIMDDKIKPFTSCLGEWLLQTFFVDIF